MPGMPVLYAGMLVCLWYCGMLLVVVYMNNKSKKYTNNNIYHIPNINKMKLRNIITGRGKGVSLKIKHSNSIQKNK